MNLYRFPRLTEEGVRRQRTTSLMLGVLWIGLGVVRTFSVRQAGFAIWLTVASFALAAAFIVRGLIANHELHRREREPSTGPTAIAGPVE